MAQLLKQYSGSVRGHGEGTIRDNGKGSVKGGDNTEEGQPGYWTE